MGDQVGDRGVSGLVGSGLGVPTLGIWPLCTLPSHHGAYWSIAWSWGIWFFFSISVQVYLDWRGGQNYCSSHEDESEEGSEKENGGRERGRGKVEERKGGKEKRKGGLKEGVKEGGMDGKREKDEENQAQILNPALCHPSWSSVPLRKWCSLPVVLSLFGAP